MKLSQDARQQGISYSTALRWWHQGAIRGYQAPSGTIIVEIEAKPPPQEERVVIYARVSSAERRENLERQVEWLVQYCTVRGSQIAQVVKEIASRASTTAARNYWRCSKAGRPLGSWSSRKTG